MKRVVIQPGHINVQHNSNTELRGSTGAPGEQEFNLRIANRVSELLRERGVEVKQTDANANDDPAVTGVDWDLYVAIHADADIYGTGGGFIDFPDPSVDAANEQSKAFCNALRSEYFKHSEIVEHPERSNANTRFYYMWRALSPQTPSIIIECLVLHDAHDKVIAADTERVSTAIVRGICLGLSVPYDVAPVGGTGIPTVIEKQYTKEEYEAVIATRDSALVQLDEAKRKHTEISTVYTALQAVGITTVDDLQKERDGARRKEEGYITQLEQVTKRAMDAEQRAIAAEKATLEKDQEDATSLSELRDSLKRIEDLEQAQYEIAKALGVSAKSKLDDLLGFIAMIRDAAKRSLKKVEVPFDPGTLAPTVTTKTSGWDFLWKVLGITVVAGLITGASVMMLVFSH